MCRPQTSLFSMACVSLLAAIGGTGELKAAPLPSEPNNVTTTAVLDASSTLSDYLAYAALNNPGLEAAFDRWKAALERVPQSDSLPDPRFSYRYFIQEIETRVGPQRQAFEITQTFPWFGKLRLAGGVAAQAADTARQDYEAARLRLFSEVKDAFYEFYYLVRAIDVTGANVQLLQDIEAVTRIRYETASGAQSDLIRTQVETGKLQDRINTLEDQIGPAKARLNAVLNRTIDADLPNPGPFQPTPVTAGDQALLDLVEQANPQVKALDHVARRYAEAAALARKQYAPDVTLGLSMIDVARSDMAARFPDNGKDAVAAMVSMNIPLWGRRTSAAVREAELSRRAALRQKTDTVNQLKSQLTMALVRLRDADRKLDLYTHGLLPKAGQSLKVNEEAFRAGTGSFLDMVDAQRTCLEFQLARERALADHEQALARIEMLVGKDNDAYQAQKTSVGYTK